MNKKPVLFLIGVLVFAIFSLGASAISATQTLNFTSPAAGSFITGTITLRAEVNGTNYSYKDGGNADTTNVTNVTFSYSTNAGSTWTVVGTNSSNVNNGTLANWTYAFSTLTLADTSSYVWRAQVFNNSNGNHSIITSPSVSATVDNTVPTVDFGKSASYQYTSGAITATAVNASSCSIQFSASQVYAMALSGTTCSYTLDKNVVPDSDYDVKIMASDGTNVTTVDRLFSIALRQGDVTSQPSGQSSSGSSSGSSAGILIIIAIAVLALSQGKKGK